MGFHEDMARLQKSMKNLEKEYDQWFAGALATPPWKTKKIVEDIVQYYSRNIPQSIEEQAIFSMHQAKYMTYSGMWNRRMLLKEEGKRMTRREERPQVRSLSSRAKVNTADNNSLRKVYAAFVSAKQKMGQGTETVNYENFREILKKEAFQLREKRGYKEVNFEVSVKSGKVSVVARAKR